MDITPRIVGPNYLIPEGLKKQLKKKALKVIYNWGLSWDPATVLNGNLYIDDRCKCSICWNTG